MSTYCLGSKFCGSQEVKLSVATHIAETELFDVAQLYSNTPSVVLHDTFIMKKEREVC